MLVFHIVYANSVPRTFKVIIHFNVLSCHLQRFVYECSKTNKPFDMIITIPHSKCTKPTGVAYDKKVMSVNAMGIIVSCLAVYAEVV